MSYVLVVGQITDVIIDLVSHGVELLEGPKRVEII